MCGIFGFKNFNIDTNKIKSELNHRGPDSFNIIKTGNITFCNSRLSVIDLSDKAMQPMILNGNIISFNGEIYNYKELYEEYLEGVELHSMSDTEILLNLIQRYGFKILNKLNGMFAFSYYDNNSQSVFLVRDRYGVKPLYYYILGNSFAFCSEDYVLMRVLNIPFSVNPAYISNLLDKNISDFDDNSIIKNIFSVNAGEYVEITKQNKIIKNKYYYYNDYDTHEIIYKNKREIINDFENLLADSIRLRNRSDTPIALTLSGGVDSSLIYTLSKEKLNIGYTLFTYSNMQKNLDEYTKAKRLADDYNDNVIKIEYNNQNFLENYGKSLIALNAPIWSCAHAGYYEVYKKINEAGFKVVMEGHGADEIFGGYPFTFRSAAVQAFAERKYKLCFDIINLYSQTNKISIDKINYIDLIKSLFKVKDSQKNIFFRTLDYIFRKKVLPISLRCYDRIPMANSVESRSPFLDYRIVEYTRALPIEYKINKIGNKAILREILKKYNKDYIYKNKKKQPFLTSELKFLSDNSKFMLKYYNNDKYDFDISKWITQDFSQGYNPNIYKACALGFLEDYYKSQ